MEQRNEQLSLAIVQPRCLSHLQTADPPHWNSTYDQICLKKFCNICSNKQVMHLNVQDLTYEIKKQKSEPFWSSCFPSCRGWDVYPDEKKNNFFSLYLPWPLCVPGGRKSFRTSCHAASEHTLNPWHSPVFTHSVITGLGCCWPEHQHMLGTT